MVTRREWLELLGRSALSGTLVAACGGGDGGPDGGVQLDLDGGIEPGDIDTEHAVATFEVTDRGALIAAYARRPRWAVAIVQDLETSEVIASPMFMLARDDGRTGWVDIDGLAAARDYRYHLRFDTGDSSQWHQFRTAPAADADADVSFVFSADIDTDPNFASPIFESMAARPANFFVCLGDWPYADNISATSLSEFQQAHREGRMHPQVRPVLESMGIYAIYDDHEARNDWDGKFRVTEAERINNALEVWDQWFPLRRVADGPRYRTIRWGRHLELFILDTRLYRSANADPDGPDKTMLGATQKQWLLDGLRQSDASFKVIATSVPLDFGTTTDHWAQFATERDEMLGVITSEMITGVLFITADQHWFAAHHFDSGIIEYQVGPLSRGLRDLPAPTSETIATARELNFGELTITGGAQPRAVFTARDVNGDTLFSEPLEP